MSLKSMAAETYARERTLSGTARSATTSAAQWPPPGGGSIWSFLRDHLWPLRGDGHVCDPRVFGRGAQDFFWQLRPARGRRPTSSNRTSRARRRREGRKGQDETDRTKRGFNACFVDPWMADKCILFWNGNFSQKMYCVYPCIQSTLTGHLACCESSKDLNMSTSF